MPQIENDGPHMRRCSRCGRSFASRDAADRHIAQKHKGKGTRVAVRRDEEESLADIAVDAERKRAAGEPLDPMEKALLGE